MRPLWVKGISVRRERHADPEYTIIRFENNTHETSVKLSEARVNDLMDQLRRTHPEKA